MNDLLYYTYIGLILLTCVYGFLRLAIDHETNKIIKKEVERWREEKNRNH